MEKLYDEKISLLRLILVAALLSFPLQFVYEVFTVEDVFEESATNKSISIHFGDLLNLFLYEYFIVLLATLFVLLVMSFLYLYLRHRREIKIK